MLLLTGLLVPIAMLLLLLGMERVEQPLRVDEVGDDVREYLDEPEDDIPPDQVESLVREGYGPALQRYWRRRRMLSLLRREG